MDKKVEREDANLPKKRQLSKSKLKTRPADAPSFSAVDLAVLGAVLALTASKAGGANALDDRVIANATVDPLVGDDAFGKAIQALSGASAEVLLLAALAENLHRDLARSLKESSFSTPVASDTATFNWAHDPTLTSLSSSPVVVGDISTKSDLGYLLAATTPANTGPATLVEPELRSYGQDLEKMQKASQDLLDIMREMFGKEMESVQARQIQQPNNPDDTQTDEVWHS